jgi:hypothetical protein
MVATSVDENKRVIVNMPEGILQKQQNCTSGCSLEVINLNCERRVCFHFERFQNSRLSPFRWLAIKRQLLTGRVESGHAAAPLAGPELSRPEIAAPVGETQVDK